MSAASRLRRLSATWLFASCLAVACPAAGAPVGSGPACRAEVTLSPARAVVGEQVLYRVRIVSREDVRAVEWSRVPSFARVRTEGLPGDPQPADALPPPGFRVRDERRALFADAPGTYRLEAPELRCRLRSGAVETAAVPVASLEVVPVPEQGRPADFAGLVGPLRLHVTVTPREVSLGESVRVAVMLRGEGNLWSLVAPLEASDFPDADLFERRPRSVLERGRRLVVRRHFAWDVVPRVEGTLTIPPLAVPYFDTGRGAYDVLRSDPVRVAVAPRPPAPAEGSPAEDAPPEAQAARGRDASGSRAWRVGVAVTVGAAAALAGWAWLRRRRSPGLAATDGDDGADEATRLDRDLRAALARHVPDASSVTAQELLAREPDDPAVASAARLLASLERARFDPRAPAPDAAAVRRAIESLRPR